MVNYANSKVYKIWSTQGDKIYVGSTTKQYLSQRMDKHRSHYKCWKNNNFNFITAFKLFEEYGLENCFIELIESKDCASKDELHKLEGKYIRELDCVNRVIIGRTNKEYYEDNKDVILSKTNKYKEINKESIIEKNKQYRNDNKEKIEMQHKQKFNCLCGGKYTHCNKTQHLKSIKHCKFIESQEVKQEVYEV